MQKYHFSTVVSKDHIFKFIAMYVSLHAHCSDYTLYVLCGNDIVYDMLTAIGYQHVIPVRLRDVEDDRLLYAKRDRIFHAFCWTLKPFFLHYVMTHFPDAQYFAHLDADLCFFANPDPVFEEDQQAILFLTHHRNSERFLQFYNLTGTFNTGFVGCKNDPIAVKAVEQWKDQCIEYCPIKEDPINKVFGDQRYVEEWPSRWDGVHIVKTVGANAALWNITDYEVRCENRTVSVNGEPLIFYHFSGLAIANRLEYNICWYYHIDNDIIVHCIYVPYLNLLKQSIDEISAHFPAFQDGFLKKEYMPNTHFYTLPE